MYRMPVGKKDSDLEKTSKKTKKSPTSTKKKTTKKYATRKSPAYPANEYCGKRKKGNDGNMYESKADKNGICKWIKVKK
jgi:hypothetical protein